MVKEIKRRVRADFPVSLRFSVKSQIKDWGQGGLPGETFEERGRDLEEGLEAAQILEAAGYDAFKADCGSYDAWYWAHPPTYQEHGVLVPYVAELKKVVDVRVLVAGRMEIPELAERTLQEGSADMVTIARGLLTAGKAGAGSGRPTRVPPIPEDTLLPAGAWRALSVLLSRSAAWCSVFAPRGVRSRAPTMSRTVPLRRRTEW